MCSHRARGSSLRPEKFFLAKETSETILDVRVTPRASRDEIAGWVDGVLRLRVSAPPVEGKANAAVAKLLAGALGLPSRRVLVVRGARGRNKQVQVSGLSLAQIRERLGD